MITSEVPVVRGGEYCEGHGSIEDEDDSNTVGVEDLLIDLTRLMTTTPGLWGGSHYVHYSALHGIDSLTS
jgi:hypothetical protein